MSTTGAVLGAGGLALALVPLSLAGREFAARTFAAAPSAVRTLVAIVAVLSATLLTAEGLGTIGELHRWPLLVGLAAVGLALRYLVLRWRGGVADPDDGAGLPATGGPGRVLGLVALAVVSVQWLSYSILAVSIGVRGADSINYHLPTALAFAQDGTTSALVQIDPRLPVTFYPDGAELLHSIGLSVLGSHVLSCFAGLAAAALAFLAAWVLGARWGRGWRAVLLLSPVLAAPIMVTTQAGTALVDVTVLALVLTAVAVLVWSLGRGRLLLGFAGLAGGGAIAVKLTALPVVAVACLGVVVISLRRPGGQARVQPALAYGFGAIVLPGYWLVRNLVHSGSPLPAVHLPGFRYQSFPLLRDAGFTVAHYAGRPHIWRTVFLPALGRVLGDGWPLLLALPVLGAVLVLRQGRDRRLLGLLALAAMAGYLVTPFSAGGPDGRPQFLFFVNVRYLSTGLALGAVALASICWRRRADQVLAGTGVVALGLAIWPHWVLDSWPRQHGAGPVLIAIGVAVLVAIATVTLPRLSAPVRIGAVAVAALLGLGLADAAVLRAPGPEYDATRGLVLAYRWANTVHHQRIAFAGFAGYYPLAGVDLSNQVTYVGISGPHGSYHNPTDCSAWRSELTVLRPTYLVLGDGMDLQRPVHPEWVRSDPAAVRVAEYFGVTVWRYTPTATAAAC